MYKNLEFSAMGTNFGAWFDYGVKRSHYLIGKNCDEKYYVVCDGEIIFTTDNLAVAIVKAEEHHQKQLELMRSVLKESILKTAKLDLGDRIDN